MLEDRPAFLQTETMPWAERLRLVDFNALPELPLGVDTSVAIVTRGHDHDLVVLRQLIGKPVNYLGMIGSRRKRELFRRILTEEGCSRDDFERLRSPMGMDIGAETPAEIAVSVVAELVAARRSRALEDAATLRQMSV
jgi:xanthine dehydrogenase accessory factor